jgi:hypothetical protein
MNDPFMEGMTGKGNTIGGKCTDAGWDHHEEIETIDQHRV